MDIKKQNQKQKNKSGLMRLFEIAGQKKTLLLFSCILSCISAIAMLVPYLSVYKILEELLQNASNTANIDSSVMKFWAWVALAGLAAGFITLYCSLIFSHVAAFNILYGLRVKISRHIGRLPLGFINSSSTGAIKKTLEQNVEKIETFVAHTIPDIVGILATIVVLFIIFFSLNVWLAVVCFAVMAVSIYMQFAIFMGKDANSQVKKYYDVEENLSASAVEFVRGMPVIKIFSRNINSFKDFVRQIKEYRDFALQICDLYEKPLSRFIVGLNSIVAFILPVGIVLFERSASSIAFASVWLFFIIMSPGLASPVFKLMHLGSSTRDIDEGVLRIDRILQLKPNTEPSVPKMPDEYSVTFNQVSFSYPSVENSLQTKSVKHPLALSNISFKAEKGKITALCGASGSGKSTVANLIPRFYDADSGEILIGNVNIKDIANDQLMNLVSFVFQDTFLFLDTIANNIALGQQRTNIEKIITAAKKAQCHEFIMSLPNGYQTRIGDNGINLSGGERQRICLARAIMKNAPILVLDEATAFADTENEFQIQKAIANLVKDKTVIMIAHRLSTIRNADKIIVLDNGKIAQTGTHDTLLQTEGIYKQMWKVFTMSQNWTLSV